MRYDGKNGQPETEIGSLRGEGSISQISATPLLHLFKKTETGLRTREPGNQERETGLRNSTPGTRDEKREKTSHPITKLTENRTVA